MKWHLNSSCFRMLPALGLLLVGCASAPDAPAPQRQRAASFSPPPGMAFVYVIRAFSLDRMTVMTELTLDQRRFGTLSNKTFLCAAVKPGNHELKTLSFFGDTALRFTAEAGRLYFFETKPEPDHWALEPVLEPEAREKIARYRLSGDNAFEAGGPSSE
jgi:hypothetical protein